LRRRDQLEHALRQIDQITVGRDFADPLNSGAAGYAGITVSVSPDRSCWGIWVKL